MDRPMFNSTGSAMVLWSIYYIDKNGQLNCMDVELPCSMDRDAIRDYVSGMGYEIDKAISELHCYTY